MLSRTCWEPWKTEETAIEFLFLVRGDLRGSVSHESGISPAKTLAKDSIKRNLTENPVGNAVEPIRTSSTS